MSMDRGGQGSWGGCTLFCPWIRAVSVPYFGRGSGEVDHREQTTLLTLVWSRSTHLALYCLYYMYRVFWLAEKGSIWTKRDIQNKILAGMKTVDFSFILAWRRWEVGGAKKKFKTSITFLFVLVWNVQKHFFAAINYFFEKHFFFN